MKAPARTLLLLLAAVVLVGVFMLYTQPTFMRDMADYVWACF